MINTSLVLDVTPERPYHNFSGWVTYHRSANGWSLRELADKIGMSASYIGILETGRWVKDSEERVIFTPKRVVVEKLASAFGLDSTEPLMLTGHIATPSFDGSGVVLNPLQQAHIAPRALRDLQSTAADLRRTALIYKQAAETLFRNADEIDAICRVDRDNI